MTQEYAVRVKFLMKEFNGHFLRKKNRKGKAL